MSAWKFTDVSNKVVFRVLLNGSMESKLVTALEEGIVPELADIPDTRPAVLAEFRVSRELYLNRLAGIAIFSDDNVVKTAAKTFRQRLLDIPQDASVVAAADAATLQTALLTLYRNAAAEAATAAPAGKTEFDRIAK